MASDETLRPISDPAFAAGFPAVAEADWIRLVERALKGGSVDRLVSRTYDGISIAPLYARATGRAPLASAHRGAWDMLARIDHPHPGDANAQALTDLENGATGLHLVFRNGEGAHGFGLPCDAEAVDRVLESIVLETGVPIEIDAGRDAAEVARHVATIVEARGLEPSALQVHFGLDPVGDAARGGDAAIPPSIATLVKDLRGRGFVAPAVTADGRVIHDAGGSEAQELAFVLGSALAMMRHLHDAGLSLDDARGAISFRLTADADQFLTIAKFRALRLLWSQIERACGLSQKPVLIHAETAWRMMTQRDAFVNMLRATTGAFSAGLGGADRLTVMPFTQAIGLPDAFARRLARNVQLVLIEEANLARVVDPAAGAGGYETLTDEIASAAWTLFQESEKAGGMLAFLPDLSSRVAAVRAERCKNVARRKDPLTGATEFPNLNEMPVEVLAPLPARASGEGLFPAMRLAQSFEDLRDRSDAILARDGVRPRVYLATLGAISDFTARSMFARSFFEAGGFETVMADRSATPDDSVAGFAASGAVLACICSSDERVAQWGAETAAKLAAAGARHIYLAGRPGENEPALRDAGVAEFIHVGVDLVACLERACGIAS